LIERRRHYRKRFKSFGYLLTGEEEEMFLVRELSLSGFQASFSAKPDFRPPQSVRVRLPAISLDVKAVARWMAPTPTGGYRIGFEFSPANPAG
jgi:hypothetical protein